jgi:tRNA pseudouridine38-40 synthase
MDVPRAPGLGLLLERLHYHSYDTRFGKTHASMENLGDDVEKQILKIRDELIISEILASECQTQGMMMWIATLTMHDFSANPEEDQPETKTDDVS